MKTVLIFPVMGVSFAITGFASEAPNAAKPGKPAAENSAATDADARLEEARLTGEIVMQDMDAARSFHRDLLQAKEKEMEAAMPAQKALDEFRRLGMRLKNDNPKEWEPKIREIELYAYELENVKRARDVARLMIHAESVNARITPEDLAAAELKVREMRLQIPEGKGEFFDKARKRFEMANAYDDVMDVNSATHKECEKQIIKARRRYLELPMATQQTYDPVIEKFQERLMRLREEAESAKWAELKGEANQLPEDKRWPAAKKRFDEALTEPVDLGN
jgi:hypothetical protein